MSGHTNADGRVSERFIIRSAQDVIDLINSGRVKGGNAGAIVLIALGGIFIDAYDFTALAFGLPDIAENFDLSPVAVGVVGASIMVGALLGAATGGYFVDKLGRYKLFMADMLFFVVAAIGCALAPNPELLTLFRFLMGVGIGLDFPVALAFIAEYTALKGKSGRVTLWQPMWYFATGSTFALLLPLYFLVPDGAHDSLWRWAVGFGAVPAVIVLLVRHRYMNESAAWAARQGDLHRAAGILRDSFGADAVVAPDVDTTPAPVRPKTSIRDYARLFSPQYRRRTVLAGVVGATQSMQYYAVGFALPIIITTFLELGRLTAIVGPLIFNFAFGVTGGFLGVYLADRIGSWKLSTLGFSVTTSALVILGIIGQPQSTALLGLVGVLLGAFVFFHSAGPGAQGMTMATLSYPTSLRGTGAGFGQAVLRIGSTTSLVLFPILSEAFGTGVYFAVAVAPIAGLVALLTIRWDPVGRDIDAEDFAASPTTSPAAGQKLDEEPA